MRRVAGKVPAEQIAPRIEKRQAPQQNQQGEQPAAARWVAPRATKPPSVWLVHKPLRWPFPGSRRRHLEGFTPPRSTFHADRAVPVRKTALEVNWCLARPTLP